HTTDCQPAPDQPCRGCHPGLAADGLLICTHHRRQGQRHLEELPALDNDLAHVTVRRTQAANVGYVTDGQAASGIVLDDHVLAAKAAIRETLTKLVGFIAHHRGIAPSTNDGDTRAMVSWLTP